MKRFISFILLAVMLCTAASADVLVCHISESYCVAYSYDDQHCLMMERLPAENSMPFSRLYIQHADGSVSPLKDVDPADPDSSTPPPDYTHVPHLAVNGVKVCGNMLLMNVYVNEYRTVFRLVDMTTGEARSLGTHSVVNGVCGQQAAIAVNKTAKTYDVWLLDGNSGELTQQTIPDDIRIYAVSPLSSGILLCVRDGVGEALLWLDEQGNVVHRLPCERDYDQLYYDESTRTGIAASNMGYPTVWFNDHVMMQLLPLEITGHFETMEEFLALLESNPLHVSLLPQNTNKRLRLNVIQPLGMTAEGTLLCRWA